MTMCVACNLWSHDEIGSLNKKLHCTVIIGVLVFLSSVSFGVFCMHALKTCVGVRNLGLYPHHSVATHADLWQADMLCA